MAPARHLGGTRSTMDAEQTNTTWVLVMADKWPYRVMCCCITPSFHIITNKAFSSSVLVRIDQATAVFPACSRSCRDSGECKRQGDTVQQLPTEGKGGAEEETRSQSAEGRTWPVVLSQLPEPQGWCAATQGWALKRGNCICKAPLQREGERGIGP